jgi:hypothetical protein
MDQVQQMLHLLLKLPREIPRHTCERIQNILHICLSSGYRQSINSTALVGYAAIDGTADFLVPLAEYLSCDPSDTNSGASSIDIFGLNN